MGAYEKSFTEIYEIFKYLPEKIVNKVPEHILKAIKYNRDTTYNFQIDTSKSFKDQKLMHETYLLLAVIYRDYWASPSRVKMIRVKEEYKLSKETKNQNGHFNPDDLFKKKEG